MTSWTRRAGFVLVALASTALAVGTAAASQEDDGDGPPELTEEERAAHRAAFEEFRACMAEHGVELPEHPKGRPGEGEEGVEEAEPPEIDREAAAAAFDACRDLVPPPPGVSQEELDAHRAAFDEYAACMAEQGVEVEQHIPGLGAAGVGAELSDEDRGKAEAAFEQCQELVPPPPGVSAEEFAAHRAALEEFRACLSEQGVETPGRGIPGVLGSGPEKAEPSDEQREQFEAAAEACAELRPERLPGGRGPGPGPGRERPEAPAA